MKLKSELRDFIENLRLPYDETVIFLVACKLNLNTSVDDDIFGTLAAAKIIEKDYIKNRIIVTIPIFEDDTGEIPTNVDSLRSEIKSRIDEFRILFKGIRLKSMGDKNDVTEKMIRWLVHNPDVTFDDVLNIVIGYLGNADKTYIPNADNFIYSINKFGEEVSTLSAIVEEYNLGNFDKSFA